MDFRKRAEELVGKMTFDEKIAQMRFATPAIERLGVQGYNWFNECLHGVARQGTATVFPQAIAMASSFNDDLLFKVADTISTEARAKYNQFKKYGPTDYYRGLTFWSPNINIFRDPRWGRGHETYGEDPYLTGRMGAALAVNSGCDLNCGDFDTMYSVLKFEYIPHKNLCGFKKVFLKKGEKKTLSF